MGQISTPEEIESVLDRMSLFRAGMYGDRVYVVPMTGIYRQGSIYCFTREGMKLRILRSNPAVCVQVDEIRAVNDWSSVVAWGTSTQLEGTPAADAASMLAAALYAAGGVTERNDERIRGALADGAVVLRIDLSEKTGRHERPDGDR